MKLISLPLSQEDKGGGGHFGPDGLRLLEVSFKAMVFSGYFLAMKYSFTDSLETCGVIHSCVCSQAARLKS